jgi:hypothetical protein
MEPLEKSKLPLDELGYQTQATIRQMALTDAKITPFLASIS